MMLQYIVYLGKMFMRLLQIVSHPDSTGSSFTLQAAEAYRRGAREAGCSMSFISTFHEPLSVNFVQQEVLRADHIAFHWPCWWEMPPYPLVELLQRVFVKGFAFDFDANGNRKVMLDIPTTTFVSMGQRKVFNTTNLSEAMTYCGLRPSMFYVFENVGPRQPKSIADMYLEQAYNAGKALKG